MLAVLLEFEIGDINDKLAACYRALGIANKLDDATERKKYRSRIFGHINRFRNQIKRLRLRQEESLLSQQGVVKVGARSDDLQRASLLYSSAAAARREPC